MQRIQKFHFVDVEIRQGEDDKGIKRFTPLRAGQQAIKEGVRVMVMIRLNRKDGSADKKEKKNMRDKKSLFFTWG